MAKWIEWNGGDCPIKSGETWVEYRCRHGYVERARGVDVRWQNNPEFGVYNYVTTYRIIEDNEPAMTREQMTREQIEEQIGELNRTFRERSRALAEQLAFLKSTKRYYWLNGDLIYSSLKDATHWIEVEICNGVPVSVTIKEAEKKLEEEERFRLRNL